MTLRLVLPNQDENEEDQQYWASLPNGDRREETKVNYFIVNREQLSRDGNTYELQGYQYGSTTISLILVDVPPGEGPKLHVHPYEEVLVIQEGCATYTIRSTTLEAKARQIAIVPAGATHQFGHSGSVPHLAVDIHHS